MIYAGRTTCASTVVPVHCDMHVMQSTCNMYNVYSSAVPVHIDVSGSYQPVLS